jgi:peptide deformylase
MIKKYPDPVLDEKSKSVVDNLSDKETQALISRMRRACWNANGFGIAAVQIGEPFQIFGYLSKSSKDLEWIIDPEIISSSGSSSYEEGCLSIPGYFWKVYRPEKVTLRYKDISMNDRVKTFKGIESRVIQHEIDHLDGLCIPDSLTDKDFVDFVSHFQSGSSIYEYNSPVVDLR